MKPLDYELKLLKKLVSIDTNCDEKNNYEKMASFLCKEAEKLGLKSEVIYSKAKDRKPRPNVIITLNKNLKKTLMFATHYDTVPHSKETRKNLFKMKKEKDTLYGLGVSDDKGAIAVAFGALKSLNDSEKLSQNIKFVIACDEEVGGKHGFKFLSVKYPEKIMADSCIVIDSSLNHAGIGCSGVIRTKIMFVWKEGHAGYAFRNPNNLHNLVPFMNDLLSYEKKIESYVSVANAPSFAPYKKVPGRMNLTIIHSGWKLNVIPGSAYIGIDIRVPPELSVRKPMKEFKVFIKTLFEKHKLNGKIMMLGTNGYLLSEDSFFVKKFVSLLKKMGCKSEIAAELGGTDGRFIARLGIPTIGYGPGGKNPHTADESITVQELKHMKSFLINLAEN